MTGKRDSFDDMIRNTERWLRGGEARDPPSAPVSPSASMSPSVSVRPPSPSPAPPPELSEDEYPDAQVWLDKIARLRRLLERNRTAAPPWLEEALVTAFEVGQRDGVHGYEDRIGYGHGLRATQRAKGTVRGRTISDEARALDAKITPLAAQYRGLYPYDRLDNSTRAMGCWIADKLDTPVKTILNHLAKLHLR